MKRSFCSGLCLALLFVAAAVAAGEFPVDVKGVTAISETTEEGEKFVALAVEYTEAFEAGVPKRSSYEVRGREIKRVYVNDSGMLDDARATGRFVMVELALSQVPGCTDESTRVNTRKDGVPGNINHPFPPNPIFHQKVNLKAASGAVAPLRFLETTAWKNPLADTFGAYSYTDAESGMTMKYRLYVPKGYEKNEAGLKKLPLVLFLHGSGERGPNNTMQLLANPSALEFARPAAQATHPCFVLAPQNPKTLERWAENFGTAENPKWSMTTQLEVAKRIIDKLIGEFAIDTARIYGSGLSQGSKGTMMLCITYPGLFAAQINSSGVDVYTDADAASVIHKPIWNLIAVDDSTNPSANCRRLMDQFEKAGAKVVRRTGGQGWNAFLRGPAASALAREQWDAAKAQGSNILYTEYIAGTVEPHPHWSWMANFSNAVVRDWLFSNVNPMPYKP